jgi:hypothetical protein
MWLSLDDVYSVSNEGQVMKHGKLMKGATDSSGYRQVSQHGRLKMIHRLVASRFLPAPPTNEMVEIDHIDRDRSNNNASNLRWCSRSTNMRNKNHKTSSDTGEQYITKYTHKSGNVRYIFRIQRDELYIQKYFETLQDAIDFKNTFLTSNA